MKKGDLFWKRFPGEEKAVQARKYHCLGCGFFKDVKEN